MPEPSIYSPAAERNALPIAEKLRTLVVPHARVFEIGSGTGQHARFFTENFPELIWQPSDVHESLPYLQQALAGSIHERLKAPIAFNAIDGDWDKVSADIIYTANTFHIMSDHGWKAVIDGASRRLSPGGRLVVYGPMRYAGRELEPSNQAFDDFLRERDPKSGIRNADAIFARAAASGLRLDEDHAMPANNRLFVFSRV